jgi:hypothetical protein
MEMGILEDHRRTGNHLSYQKLTDTGRKIYQLMQKIEFPYGFFERISRNSWRMKLKEKDYIGFTQALENVQPKLFEILKRVFLKMQSSMDLIRFFLEEEKTMKRIDLYTSYFRQDYIRSSFEERGLRPHAVRNIETARRRVSVIVGLLESVNVMKGWGGKQDQPVTLYTVPEELFEAQQEKIEKELVEKVKGKSKEEIQARLEELERVPPKTQIYQIARSSSTRNAEVEALRKQEENYICKLCGVQGFEKEGGGLFIHVHHMIPLAEKRYKNPDKPSNILVVCSWCHDKLEHGTKDLKRSLYNRLLENGAISEYKMKELRKFEII